MPPTFSTRPTELSFKDVETKISNVFKSAKENAKLQATYSGTCGTNVNWSLDTSTGKLTISGSGMIDDFDTYKTPWYPNHTLIKTLLMEKGITHIGSNTLSQCIGLTWITIPNSVISIGNDAFNGCTRLNTVIIPNSVTSIGPHVFYDCPSLTSLTIPDSVTFIGDHTFCSCYFTSIVIPNSVKSIGSHAFHCCPSLISVIIPNSVTSIGNNAFSWSEKLTSLTIPASVVFIDDSAFYECKGLASVTYKGTLDPGASSSGVFYNMKATFVKVSEDYKDNHFCGVNVSRLTAPTQTLICSRSPSPTLIPPQGPSSTTAASFKEWFTNNVAWLAPIFTIASGAIGLLLKYNDVKNFCLSHCCHKESETTETGTLDEKLL